MYKGVERRNYKRKKVEFQIVFTDWSSNNFHNGIVCNCGIDDINFKSNIALSPGSDILIKTKDSQSRNTENIQAGSNARAVVIWCKKIPDDDTFSYSVGAEFYEPNNKFKDKF